MENVALKDLFCTHQVNELPSSGSYQVSLMKRLLTVVFIAFSFRGVTVEQSYSSRSIMIHMESTFNFTTQIHKFDAFLPPNRIKN